MRRAARENGTQCAVPRAKTGLNAPCPAPRENRCASLHATRKPLLFFRSFSLFRAMRGKAKTDNH